MARQSERDYINQRIPKTFRLHPDRIAELDAMARDRYISQARVIEELIQDAARPTIDDRYRRLKEKEAASIEQARPAINQRPETRPGQTGQPGIPSATASRANRPPGSVKPEASRRP